MKALVIAVAAAGLLSACGSSGAASSDTPAATSTPPATASPSAGTSPTDTPTALPATAAATPTATAVAVSGCTFHAGETSGNNFAGHSVLTVVLTNTGAAACTLNGYPTLTLRGPGGVVSSPAEVDGGGQAAKAAPSPITVTPGGTARFVVEFSDVGPGASPCPTVTSIDYELPSSAGTGTLTLSGTAQPCPPTYNVGAITA